MKRLTRWLLRCFPYVRQLEEERDRAVDDFVDYVAGKATLDDIAVRNGTITMAIGTDLAHYMAANMVELLDGHGAENYVEILLRKNDGTTFTLTVQRCEGQTPHELRRIAEDKLADHLAKHNTDG